MPPTGRDTTPCTTLVATPREALRPAATLSGSMTTLRELRLSDAPALFESLTMDAVARFISPPPSSVEGFERFIAWTLRQRVAGQYVCFAVVPRGSDVAILFQIRSLEPAFGNAEWGFAIDSRFWGTWHASPRGACFDGKTAAAMAHLRKIGAIEQAVTATFVPPQRRVSRSDVGTMLREDWTNAAVLSGSRLCTSSFKIAGRWMSASSIFNFLLNRLPRNRRRSGPRRVY
jgi:hypothetical protein